MRKTERKRKPLMLSYLPPSTAMDSISYFPPNPTSQPKPNLFQNPPFASDRQIPLFNLSILRQKIDSLRRSLSQSLDSSSPIAPHQIDLATSEIVSAVHQIIINGAALIASSQDQSLCPEIEDRTVRIAGNVSDVVLRTTPNIAGTVADPIAGESARMLDLPDGRNVQIAGQESEISRFVREVDDLIAGKAAEPSDTRDSIGIQSAASGKQRNSAELRTTESGDGKEDGFDANTEVVELDMVELLVEHVHFCSICGKGFKRDANLRMHMRAHGNQFKTVEALVKPDKSEVDSGRKIRFSCPFSGCNRNQSHKRFRPLKSALCVKNHFKRSHCPKMYSCSRCNKKSFSVLADLKSHLKHCGECRWRCSCGTTFSRKDKLLGHVTLFDGHMPVVVEDKSKEEVRAVEEGDEGDHFDASCRASDFGLLENVFEGFDSTARGSFEDVMGFL